MKGEDACRDDALGKPVGYEENGNNGRVDLMRDRSNERVFGRDRWTHEPCVLG